MEQTGMKAEDVDRCMTLGANYPMGPLALIDLIGVDVAVAIGEALYDDSGEGPHRPPGRLIALVDEGKRRPQAGAGFYASDLRGMSPGCAAAYAVDPRSARNSKSLLLQPGGASSPSKRTKRISR